MRSIRFFRAAVFLATSVVSTAVIYALGMAIKLLSPWRPREMLSELKLASFRIIKALKDVYRESYQTNGQSLGTWCLRA